MDMISWCTYVSFSNLGFVKIFVKKLHGIVSVTPFLFEVAFPFPRAIDTSEINASLSCL